MDGPVRLRGQHVEALLGVFGTVVEDFPEVPVVEDLVVVPLDVDGTCAAKPKEALVDAVVGAPAPELVDGLGDLRLLRRDDVVPGAAVAGRRDGVGERAVGVNRVAAVQAMVDEMVMPPNAGLMP
ncbi:hypothetical protein AB0F91_23450 [Amycolatopsis sp. NPDC023774]|uniref:hypothetical protein n=1 Tax=Amycolatopsis sp. NPDC023774 TaxID=3155015 RepID=UPI0033E84472